MLEQDWAAFLPDPRPVTGVVGQPPRPRGVAVEERVIPGDRAVPVETNQMTVVPPDAGSIFPQRVDAQLTGVVDLGALPAEEIGDPGPPYFLQATQLVRGRRKDLRRPQAVLLTRRACHRRL